MVDLRRQLSFKLKSLKYSLKDKSINSDNMRTDTSISPSGKQASWLIIEGLIIDLNNEIFRISDFLSKVVSFCEVRMSLSCIPDKSILKTKEGASNRSMICEWTDWSRQPSKLRKEQKHSSIKQLRKRTPDLTLTTKPKSRSDRSRWVFLRSDLRTRCID